MYFDRLAFEYVAVLFGTVSLFFNLNAAHYVSICAEFYVY